MHIHAIFAVLLLLTGASAGAAHAGQGAFLLLGLGCAKLLLVAFGFMGISKAHLLWKGLVIALPLSLLAAMMIVLY